MAQAPKNIVTLRESLNAAESVKLENLSGNPGAVLKDETELDRMRTHLLNHYRGAESQHSFVDANGSVFDCIPVRPA